MVKKINKTVLLPLGIGAVAGCAAHGLRAGLPTSPERDGIEVKAYRPVRPVSQGLPRDLLTRMNNASTAKAQLARWDRENQNLPADLKAVERRLREIQLRDTRPYADHISKEEQRYWNEVELEKGHEMEAAMKRGDAEGAIASYKRWKMFTGISGRSELAEWLQGHPKEALGFMKEALFADRRREISSESTSGAYVSRMLELSTDPDERRAILDRFQKNVRDQDAEWIKSGHKGSAIEDMGAEAYMHSTAIGTLEAQGKPEEALKHVGLMVTANPNSLSVLKRAAEITFMHGKIQEAKVYAARAYRLMPVGRDRELYGNLYMLTDADKAGPQP
jgi:tetratricopeptide (TPR) repeat protein